MRTRLIASLAALLATGPVTVAFAQSDDDPGDTGEAVSGDFGDDFDADFDETRTERDVARPTRGDRVQTRRDGARESAPGQVHTVVPGDTLWDLSQSYLGSPWYWPKVWSYNPQVANPHWIYPGDQIRFFGSGEEVPARVEVGDRLIATTGGDEQTFGGDEEEGSVQATGRIGYEPAGPSRSALQGFVTQRELEESGKIEGSFAETNMLSFPDTVYIRFKDRDDVQVGGRYVVFRTSHRVRHPSTKARLGYLTHFLGTVRVLSVDREYVTAQIDGSWDEIRRGDLIGPLHEDLAVQLVRRPNDREMEATLVELLEPHVTLAGEHQTVVVDRGASDGVQPGNTFHIVRQQDLGGNLMRPERGQNDKWPVETVGACVVLDVKDKASTCLLVRSIRELYRGDRMVMRVDGQTTARR